MSNFRKNFNMKYLGLAAALGLGAVAYFYLRDTDSEANWISEEVGLIELGLFP